MVRFSVYLNSLVLRNENYLPSLGMMFMKSQTPIFKETTEIPCEIQHGTSLTLTLLSIKVKATEINAILDDDDLVFYVPFNII